MLPSFSFPPLSLNRQQADVTLPFLLTKLAYQPHHLLPADSEQSTSKMATLNLPTSHVPPQLGYTEQKMCHSARRY